MRCPFHGHSCHLGPAAPLTSLRVLPIVIPRRRASRTGVTMATSTSLRVRAVGLLAVLTMLVAACGSSSSGTGAGATMQAGPGVDVQAKTITLGILTPLTGPIAAPIGIPLTAGGEPFLKAVNHTGGIA